jgi:hypothetical protein
VVEAMSWLAKTALIFAAVSAPPPVAGDTVIGDRDGHPLAPSQLGGSVTCVTAEQVCFHNPNGTTLGTSPRAAVPAAADCCAACAAELPLCHSWVWVRSSDSKPSLDGMCHLFDSASVVRDASTPGMNCTSGLAPATQLQLGSFLLADGDIFTHMDGGIAATLERPTKVSAHGPIIGPEYPWEGTMHFYGSAVTLAEDDHRMYYACDVGGKTAQASADSQSAACVAVSTDGVKWTKPMLPYIPFSAAHPKTNMVFMTGAGWFDSMLALPVGVNIEGIPVGTRLLMAFDDGSTDATERALQLAVSTDGYRFTRLRPPPRLPPSFADTSVSLAFDPLTRNIIAYGREDGAKDRHPGQVCGHYPPPADWNMHSVRAVRRAYSPPTSNGTPSVLNWQNSTHLPFSFDVLDVQCLDIYNTAATIVGAALHTAVVAANQSYERAFLAFPAVYLHYGQEENNGVLDVRFAFSRDGKSFRYVGGDRRAYIPRGVAAPVYPSHHGLQPSLFTQPDDGVPAAWDSAITYAFRGLIDHRDGTQSMYYFGQQGSHAHQGSLTRGKFGIGRVSIMRDRWIALGADSPVANHNGSAVALLMRSVPLLLPQCSRVEHALFMTLNAEVSDFLACTLFLGASLLRNPLY